MHSRDRLPYQRNVECVVLCVCAWFCSSCVFVDGSSHEGKASPEPPLVLLPAAARSSRCCLSVPVCLRVCLHVGCSNAMCAALHRIPPCLLGDYPHHHTHKHTLFTCTMCACVWYNILGGPGDAAWWCDVGCCGRRMALLFLWLEGCTSTSINQMAFSTAALLVILA